MALIAMENQRINNLDMEGDVFWMTGNDSSRESHTNQASDEVRCDIRLSRCIFLLVDNGTTDMAVSCSTFYVDESGPKRFYSSHEPQSEREWFAYGGIIINDEDVEPAKIDIEKFRNRWPQLNGAPLHSTEIRNAKDNFSWLRDDSDTRASFIKDLDGLLTALPVTGVSCVIDRKGYEARHGNRSGSERWSLCKTAFAIAVERAAKFSVKNERKLRVYAERCSKKDDDRLRGYFSEMKAKGLWFDKANSAAYCPLDAATLDRTLYEFDCKTKESLLMTVADLYLWPMCVSGYDQGNKAFTSLMHHRRIIDCLLSESELSTMGIKYSCFEKTKTET